MPEPERHGIRELFDHRIFLLFWGGALLSNIGNWMENAAANWTVVAQVADPKRGAFLSEMLNVADFLPYLLLALIAGVLTDRLNRRRFLWILQLAACLLGTLLAILAYAGLATPGPVIWVTFAEGIVWALNGPVWLATVPLLVPRELLPRAVTLNAVQFNLARLVGPALAGLIILHWGVPAAFACNAISFFLVLLAIWKLPDQISEPPKTSWLEDLREGLGYVWDHRGLRRLVFQSCAFILLGSPLQGLMAAYTHQQLQGTARLYGFMMGAFGLGALLGALALTRIPLNYPRHHLIPLSMFGCAACMLAFALVRPIPLALGLLVASGALWVMALNPTNAANQLLARDTNRGRVMSVMLLCNNGSMCLGHLAAGLLTRHFSVPSVLIGTLSLQLLVMLGFVLRREPAIDGLEMPAIRVERNLWGHLIETLSARSHRKK